MIKLLSFSTRISYGTLAAAMFLVCLLSGVFLSAWYDITRPFSSLTALLLFNPWASLFRNIHFWSAQFFLVSSLIHLWGYLRERHFTIIRPAVWLRLVAGIFFLFLLMFTGFLLKGDADSVYASQIFRTLLLEIPWAGQLLTELLLGKPGDLQLPYVHHIATTTLILVFLIREHAGRIWPGLHYFFYATLATFLFSLFLNAPVHDGFNETVKGPWYFAGIQEILHHLSNPRLLWAGFALFLILIFLLRFVKEYFRRIIRYSLLLVVIAYTIFSLAAIFFRGPYWQWADPLQGENSLRTPRTFFVLNSGDLAFIPDSLSPLDESCIYCHSGVKGLGPGHQPSEIGCFSCHDGDRFSMDKDRAHGGMRIVPGMLADAQRSCGNSRCHPDIIPRIENSLMTSLSGLIGVDRWVFGEAPSPDERNHVRDVGHSPSGTHLRSLCLSCHLGGVKELPAPPGEDSRGGGCLACHLTYSPEARIYLNAYNRDKTHFNYTSFVHPAIDMQVRNVHCFGCHSRSGRISTNYEGWQEILPDEMVTGDTAPIRYIGGSRPFRYAGADVHHTAGMICTDCHNSREVMGDGKHYPHKEDAVKISCTDCHTDSIGNTLSLSAMDYEAAKILRLLGYDAGRRYLAESRSGRAIPGASVTNDGQIRYKPRKGGKSLDLKAPAAICTKGEGHKDLHCSACHAAWASRCLGCHTSWEGEKTAKDLLTRKPMQGRWVEGSSDFMACLPGLAVQVKTGGVRSIRPAVPGMIMTLDKSGFPGIPTDNGTSHRLFSILEPHTTQKKGRSCRSCHADPVTLGYGSGKLIYRIDGRRGTWVFKPDYAINLKAGIPEDAWTGFLQEGTPPWSTRSNVRPFTREEQVKILRVGACLTCHPETSDVMIRSLDNFPLTLKQVSPVCALPLFPEQ